MRSPIRRELFWVVSVKFPTPTEAMKQIVDSLNVAAREHMGEGVIPISVDHHVAVRPLARRAASTETTLSGFSAHLLLIALCGTCSTGA